MHEALETLKEYEAFQIFIEKWHELEKNKTIPTWYRFSPKNPQERPWDPRKPFDGHGMMKKWDSAMFEFLKDQKWNEAQLDFQGGREYKEKSYFVVDCNQLLGIGGDGIVIRRKQADLFNKTDKEQNNGEYKALKIVPIMKHKFKDGDFVAKVLQAAKKYDDLKTEANVDQTELKHDNIIDYSNIQFDFIKNFEDRIFVIIIGKSTVVSKNDLQ